MYQHKEYPKCIYAAGGRTKIVNNAVEHQAAGPGWFDSPASVVAEVQPAAPAAVGPASAAPAAASPAPSAPAASSSAAAPVASDPAASDPMANQPAASEPGTALTPEQEAEKFKAEADAVYGATVATIVNSIGGASLETLERLKKIEEANPKAPRIGILRAVEDAIKKLNAAPKE